MSTIKLRQPQSCEADRTSPIGNNVSKPEAEDAVRTLISWLGDDPSREGLLETRGRVTKAFAEWFSGYRQDPAEVLAKTFQEVENYREPVMLRGIRFESCCEHQQFLQLAMA
ncbi:GTP cyclohydrolase I [Sneathiella sp.]|uniref:GTP cyclohydrolase I n=1 Tax=Sneathiella sp. TaxID=1964365 RepID=UPI0035655FC1